MNSKSGKTQLAELRSVDLVLAVVECRRVEGEFVDFITYNFVNPNWLIEDAAQMKELDLERQLLRAPQRLGGIEANVTYLVVAQFLNFLRQPQRRLVIGPVSQPARPPVDIREAKRVRSRRRRSEQECNC